MSIARDVLARRRCRLPCAAPRSRFCAKVDQPSTPSRRGRGLERGLGRSRGSSARTGAVLEHGSSRARCALSAAQREVRPPGAARRCSRVAVERVARPGRGVVAPLQQRPPGAAAGARPGRPRPRRGRSSVARCAAATGARLRGRQQLAVQPCPERPRRRCARPGLVQHDEERIDARLDRPLAQQVRAKRVDGADVRLFEVPQRVLERGQRRRVACRPLRARSSSISSRSRSFSSPAAFSVNVTATISIDVAAGWDDADDPVDERGRLAGAGSGLDDQRVVESRRDESRASLHRLDEASWAAPQLRESSSGPGACGRAPCSAGPHTGRKSQ